MVRSANEVHIRGGCDWERKMARVVFLRGGYKSCAGRVWQLVSITFGLEDLSTGVLLELGEDHFITHSLIPKPSSGTWISFQGRIYNLIKLERVCSINGVK
jgi:hypothetical protein